MRNFTCPRVNRALSLCLTVLTAFAGEASAATNASPNVEYLCRSDPGRVSEFKIPAGSVLLLRTDVPNELQRLEVPVGQKNESFGKYVTVTSEEIRKLCEANLTIATIPKPQPIRAAEPGNGLKVVISPVSSLPPAFSIVYVAGTAYGNVWVPANLPSGDTYQVADFTVAQYNFAASGVNTHFANSVLTVSNSNFDNDFDGKGMILGVFPSCGSSYSSVIETWAIQNYPGCNSPGPSTCEATVWGPDSCAEWSQAEPKRYLVGANIWQQSVYWRYTPGDSSPEFVSPGIASYTPAFRSGGAGVAFFVAASPTNQYWYLDFSDVTSYSGP